MNPPQTHIDLLERPLFAALATVRASGAPQAHAMWFLWDATAGVLKMTHTKTRHNYQFMQREPCVAVLIMDPDNPYRYLQIRGKVERIDDDPTGSFYQELALRYRGAKSVPPDAAVRVVLTVAPVAFFARG